MDFVCAKAVREGGWKLTSRAPVLPCVGRDGRAYYLTGEMARSCRILQSVASKVMLVARVDCPAAAPAAGGPPEAPDRGVLVLAEWEDGGVGAALLAGAVYDARDVVNDVMARYALATAATKTVMSLRIPGVVEAYAARW